MHKRIVSFLISCGFIFQGLFAQPSSTSEYQQLKKDGKLNGVSFPKGFPKSGTFANPLVSPGIPIAQGVTNCDCWQFRDSSFSVVPFSDFEAFPPDYRNDDGSTNVFSLPFSFCFYGTNYNQIYINNNGNISFGSPYFNFTANPFPDASFSMIAPFWGDVDTRDPGSKIVHYKLTPTYLIVQWDSVGYYNTHSDKRNTFQLIISDGTDPIIPDGNNVSFCYKDMQWTTGDASNGANGFGGEPATVGANKGDGINFLQFGRFDHAGNSFDGAFGSSDGIDWLDNQSFVFSTCYATNIPPVVTGFSICEADTVKICEFDTLNHSVTFQSPESNQTTTAAASAPGVNGFSVVSNTSGNSAIITTQFIGSQSNLGDNVITFSGTDDGTPVQTTVFDVIIHVDAAPLADAGTDTIVCNTGITLNASGGTAFLWAPTTGLSNPNIPNPVASPITQTEYIVTVSNGTCTDKDTVIVSVAVIADAGTDQSACLGDSVSLNATGGISYSWSPSAGLSDPGIANPVASPSSTTTYTVSVTDSGNCVNTDDVEVTILSLPVANAGNNISVCAGASATLNASGGTIYLWEPATGLSNPAVSNPVATPATSTNYAVIVSNGACSDTDTVLITVNMLPTADAGDDLEICIGSDTTLLATGGVGYLWIPSTGLSNPSVANPVAGPVVTTTYILTVADSNNCQDKDTVVVSVNNLPVADAGLNAVICSGSNTMLNASGGVSYYWTPGQFLSNQYVSNPTAFPSATLTYYVSVEDTNHCVNSDSVVVSVLPSPQAAFTTQPQQAGMVDTTVLFNDFSSAFSDSIISWAWTFGDNSSSILKNPSHIYSLPGEYTICLTVVSQNLCSDTVCLDYTVVPPPVFVPNIFTPNNDGKNDKLVFRYLEYYPGSRIVIYNRWGTKVYENQDYKNDWTGDKLPDGVYFFVLTLTAETKKGTITLVR